VQQAVTHSTVPVTLRTCFEALSLFQIATPLRHCVLSRSHRAGFSVQLCRSWYCVTYLANRVAIKGSTTAAVTRYAL
jgi:hypothetical protein